VKVACSETTVHGFTPEGLHLRLSPPGPPLACDAKDGNIATISRAGIMSVWVLREEGSADLAFEIDLTAGPQLKN
jgi:hypothetical protein